MLKNTTFFVAGIIASYFVSVGFVKHELKKNPKFMQEVADQITK